MLQIISHVPEAVARSVRWFYGKSRTSEWDVNTLHCRQIQISNWKTKRF